MYIRAAGQALTRLSVATGLVASVDWLLYSTIRREGKRDACTTLTFPPPAIRAAANEQHVTNR